MTENSLKRSASIFFFHCAAQGCQMVHFKNQKFNFGYILKGLGMENVGLFYVSHLAYFKAVWYILCPSGKFCVIWHTFPRFGILHQEKSGNPGAAN
jgi:hypothetical protein